MLYKLAAIAHTSTSGFAYLKLITCCRGMKNGVPATVPVRVRPLRPAVSDAFERPQCPTLPLRELPEPQSKMLCGLMWRWHEERRARYRSRAGASAEACRIERLRKTVVPNLGDTGIARATEKDVVRLDVTVNQSAATSEPPIGELYVWNLRAVSVCKP